MTITSAQGLYERLERIRQPFLDRARDAAALTIPSVILPEGHSQENSLPTPWQSVGARGVGNLSAKLMLTLFPPSSPFFRLRVDEGKTGLLEADSDVKGEVQAALAAIERQVMFEIETTQVRVKAAESLMHLVVAGNALFYYPEDEAPRIYHLDQYVVERDASDNILTIITKAMVSPMMLPEATQAALKAEGKIDNAVDGLDQSEHKNLDLYTWIRRSDTGWKVTQEVCGLEVEGVAGEYTEDTLPWIPLRMYPVSGEAYGRGQVERLIGDLRSLEGLTRAIVEAAAVAARVLPMVRPNSTTKLQDVVNAPNGQAIHGHADDVTFLSVEKSADMRIAFESRQAILTDLSQAFLLNSSIQRDAERVTAEEIRFMAQELEDALSGAYSALAQEFQGPLVTLLMRRLTKQKRIPALTKNTVRPSVITGLVALGRGHDLQKQQVAYGIIQQTFGPEVLSSHVKLREALLQIFVSAGVDADPLLKSEEELTQEQAAAQQAALAQQATPELIKQGGNAIAAAAQQPS